LKTEVYAMLSTTSWLAITVTQNQFTAQVIRAVKGF